MKEELKETSATHTEKELSRRRFLGYASLAGAGLLVASCSKDDDTEPVVEITGDVDLGTGDHGLLNYMYALVQLQAAFYTKMLGPLLLTQISAEEAKLFPQIRDHKITHRELLRNILKDKAIPDQEFDLSTINFTDRTSTLTGAQQLEDLAVSAYIGIAGRFATLDYMLVCAKMNSVGSRHAAYVRDSLSYNSFADGLDTNGMDPGMTPEDVIAKTAKYFKSTIETGHLPKS